MADYFDYAAATPLSPSVLEAMQPYWTDKFYNPSALYLPAQDVKSALAEARENVAKILQSKTSEIIFTAGGTESDNLAVRGVMEKFPNSNLVISAVEHDAVLEPASRYDHQIAPVKPDGRVDLAKLEKLINDQTVLVSVMHANNEIGTIQPLHEIAIILQKIRNERKAKNNKLPLYFHTDAAQAGNYLPLLVNALGVDLMSLNGGKIYGPKQSGILYVKTGTQLTPQTLGGGQERGLRSGTENVPNIVGFAAALAEAQAMRVGEAERLTKLRDELTSKLTTAKPDVIINGNHQYRLPNNLHITIPGSDNERLMMELDERGIMVATGSACSASSDEPSHVLRAVGLSDSDARASLRITFGRSTTAKAVDNLLANLLPLI